MACPHAKAKEQYAFEPELGKPAIIFRINSIEIVYKFFVDIFCPYIFCPYLYAN
jgi:hypothetical protein